MFLMAYMELVCLCSAWLMCAHLTLQCVGGEPNLLITGKVPIMIMVVGEKV